MNRGFHFRICAVAFASLLFLSGARVFGQQATVIAQVEMGGPKQVKKSGGSAQDLSNVVIWLSPVGGHALASGDAKRPTPTITQQNKSFMPHVLAVQVGTSVLFPNKDRFLHNVFSLHDGRQFDLGFYEAGSAKTIRFDRSGVSFLFCNIHPEMTAAVIAVETPYLATSDATGKLSITGVAEGKYMLHVWAERSLPEELKKLEREVNVSSREVNLGPIQLNTNPNFTTAHKNKYGQDYVPPASSDYSHP
jgi:plastocyanin